MFLSAFPEIPVIHEETHRNDPYFWDNAERGAGKGVILQQTLSGSVALWNDQGRHEAGEGRALIFRYGESSRYGLDAECRRPYRLRWLLLTETPAVVSLVEDLVSAFGPVVRMDVRGEASTLVEYLRESRRRGLPRDRFTDAEAACRLLIALYREQVAERRGRDPVAYGRHLLDTRFRSPRNLKEWAEEIGISREHFAREFRARYGQSPAAYLRSLRLRHARMLLVNPALAVEDVAAASGFASVKTFRRAYRNEYGEPPGALDGVSQGEPRRVSL